ncbi:MAG: glycosyltransferase family 2 protein [Planctomycetota bacterium]|jgi:glycosyltransferase involved in cell wall biosynthesis
MGSVDISVLICTFNRAEPLEVALRGIVGQQTRGRFGYEVIVVDDGSTDRTAEAVARVARAAPVEVRYLRAAGEGVGAARNRGLAQARGEWIAFTDDDQEVEPDWLRELFAAARRSGAGCVGGMRLLRLPEGMYAGPPRGCRAYLGEMIPAAEGEVTRRGELPDTGNSLVRRDVFDWVGEFDESFRHGGSDLDFFRRVRRAGVCIWRTPKAVVHHLIPPHRLEPGYLRWIALRVGVNFARVDCKEVGLLGTTALAAARAGRALLLAFPRRLWARLRDDAGAALSQDCVLATTEGYLRRTLSEVAPSLCAQERFFAALLMRREGEAFGS